MRLPYKSALVAVSLTLTASTGCTAPLSEDVEVDVAAWGTGRGYTVTINTREDRGVWEGWGTSLAWWANAAGNSNYQTTYADLFFTRQDVSFAGKALPGLGMNIVRYNVGGGGRGDIAAHPENVPNIVPWYKQIDGFWINWYEQQASSASWDFSRDANQLAMLDAARSRGVNIVELFSNAPMWWMTTSKSAAGGELQHWNRRDFARYLATVTKHAKDAWGLDVHSVEPFNEPSAGWWTYPSRQEGCNIPKEEQKEVLAHLRDELRAQGLATPITASDENDMNTARTVYDYFKKQRTPAGDRVAEVIDKVNVHAYSGLEPWRDNQARKKLRSSVGNKRIWMSEYGDSDASGMTLAQTITEDMVNLKPSAWIYWQALEASSAWGLVNGNFGSSPTNAERTRPTWVYPKYYVMAQFTRFIRPGQRLYGTSDHNTVSGYDAEQKTLSLVTVNFGNSQTIVYDLSRSLGVANQAEVTVTNTEGGRLFETSRVPITNGRFSINADRNSIYSVSVRVETLR